MSDLTPDAYRSPELHVLEVEQIFSREWLCVGREEYIPDTGDYYRFDLLGDSLIVVRGEDGQVRALSNVCRHRYMPLVDGEGNTERFVCPYHSWTYDTKGGAGCRPIYEGLAAIRDGELLAAAVSIGKLEWVFVRQSGRRCRAAGPSHAVVGCPIREFTGWAPR